MEETRVVHRLRIAGTTASFALAFALAFGAGPAHAGVLTVNHCGGFIDVTNDAQTTTGDQQITSASPDQQCASGATIDGSPPPATASSAAGGAQASASSSLTMSSTVNQSTGAVTVTATGQAQGSASATSTTDTSVDLSNLHASSNIEGAGDFVFTLSAPATFSFSGSMSASGSAGTTTDSHAFLDQRDPQTGNTTTIFDVTGDGAAQSGTLAPGNYDLTGIWDANSSAGVVSPRGSTQTRDAAASQSITFTVTPSSCANGGGTSVTVGLAVAQGCFVERQPGVFATDQEAWVGGFDLKPRSGGTLVIEPANQSAPLRAEGTGVDLVLSNSISIPAPLDELKPFTPSFTLGLNTAGSIGRVAALPLLQGASGQVVVTWAAGGAGSTVAASVSIEDLTKSVGDVVFTGSGVQVGTVAGKLTLSFANGAPFEVTAGELQLPAFAVELPGSNPPLKEGFGGGTFTALKVGDSVQWSGKVSILFPWQGENGTNQGQVSGQVFYTDGQLGGIGLGVSGFEEPIGDTGWDLTGVSGSLILSPALAFDVGVTAQEHSSLRGVPLFKLSGNVKALGLAKECTKGGNPLEFIGTANIPPLELEKIGQGLLTVTMCAYLSSAANFAFEAGVSGTVTIDALGTFKKLFTASGSASGWFHGTDFNLDGSYQLTLPIIGTIGATGVLSSEGYAFCGTYGFITEGFATNNWLDPPSDLTGCDFTPFRARPPAAADAAATGARRVTVPRGQTAVGFAVRGADGAPRVRIVGPRGQRFVTPAGTRPLKTAAAIIVPFDELRTTYVYLHRPAAGVWRIVPLAGSSTITRVDSARQLPRPHVVVRLSRLARGKFRVRWSATAIAGQRLQLLDRAQGIATIIQRLTGKHAGTITFKPSNALATSRTIEADIIQDGRPRAQLTVARYRLTLPKPPGKITHLSATRTAAGLSISWHKAAHAHDYRVTITAGSETVAVVDTTRADLILTDPPSGTLMITIQPHDTLGQNGPTTTLQVS